MFENISHHKIKAGTERNFGLVFAAVFVIISLYPLWFGKNIHLWACIIAFIFFFFAIFLPKALIVPNKLWFKFGILLRLTFSVKSFHNSFESFSPNLTTISGSVFMFSFVN